MTELQEVLVLPQLEQEENIIVLTEEGLRINGGDELLDSIKLTSDKLANYSYQPEDRQLVKKTRANLNKYIKAVKSEVKSKKDEMFKPVDDMLKAIVSETQSILDVLDEGIDEEDRQYKLTKKDSILMMYQEMIKELDNCDLTDNEFVLFFKSSWMNRNVSLKKVTSELKERMNAYQSLANFNDLPVVTKEDLIRTLNVQDWNGLNALQYLKTKEEQELEKARYIEEMKEKRERDLVKQADDSKTISTIKNDKIEIKDKTIWLGFDESRLDDVLNLLNDNHIPYVKANN